MTSERINQDSTETNKYNSLVKVLDRNQKIIKKLSNKSNEKPETLISVINNSDLPYEEMNDEQIRNMILEKSKVQTKPEDSI